MATPPHPNTDQSSDHADADFRPDSASIIHTVANRRDSTAPMKDRESAQREQVERHNIGLLLHALNEIADARIPPEQRRLIQESEVKRAIAVLRRFFLANPEVKLEELLDHCEQTATRDKNPVAHLIDPLQLRHVLTFHTGIPHETLTSTDQLELQHAVEHGPESAIVAWFERIGAQNAALPKSTPAYLRTVFERVCRTYPHPVLLEAFALESAILTLRTQGVIGFEDTRLFVSLLKQIAGQGIPGMETFLEAAETNHAAAQHRAVGNTAAVSYLRSIAATFDHTALPKLEQWVVTTAAQRAAAAVQPEPDCLPPEREVTISEPVAPDKPRRGLFSGLRDLGQSLKSRG